MNEDLEPRVDTANVVISVEDAEKSWVAAKDINAKFFKNEMTSILMQELDEPDEYLLTFAKSYSEAVQAQEKYLEEYYPHLT